MKPEFLADLIDKFFDAAIAPFATRLALLEARPSPQDGKSVTVDEIRPLVAELVQEGVKSLPAPQDGKSVTVDDIRPLVAELVQERVKALPAAAIAKSIDPEDFSRLAAAFVRHLDEPIAQ